MKSTVQSATAQEGSIQKWGNSLALRFVGKVVKTARFEQDTRVHISAEPGRIVIEAAEQAPMSLAEKLKRFDPEKHGGEAMAFKPAGREAL